MDRKQLFVVMAVALVAVGAIVVLLATGGAEPIPVFDDPTGDIVVEEGRNPPVDTTLADIRSAEVRTDGDEIVLEATLGVAVPKQLRDQTFGLRWEIHEGGDSTFLVTANLDVGPNAAIIGEQNDFGANTIDETFPGSLAIQGDRIEIRLDADQVPDFPDEFGWILMTSFDGDRGDATSALAEDRAPDQGFGEYPAGDG